MLVYIMLCLNDVSRNGSRLNRCFNIDNIKKVMPAYKLASKVTQVLKLCIFIYA
jgi:hypothetical protein